MKALLTTIEQSGLALSILTGLWWYPILLCIHALGMAFLAGLLMMIDLRILGLGSGASLRLLRRYFGIVWLALAVNFASGVFLFIGYAVSDFYSVSFRIKMILIVIGVVIAFFLQSSVMRDGSPETPQHEVPRYAKILAGVSLACWLGVITTGRLVAYLR